MPAAHDALDSIQKLFKHCGLQYTSSHRCIKRALTYAELECSVTNSSLVPVLS